MCHKCGNEVCWPVCDEKPEPRQVLREAPGYMPYRIEKKLFKMRDRLAGINENHHPKLTEFYRNEIRKIEERYTGI